MEVQKLVDENLIQDLAVFFHNKWKVPVRAYVESMQDGLKSKTGVPSWYYVRVNGEFIAGLGVIENDFHKRKDLTPNICAVFVKENYRNRGIARKMLDFVCKDLAENGIKDVYLITTHTSFYEKCGFDYYCDIEENDGNIVRGYHKKLLSNK